MMVVEWNPFIHLDCMGRNDGRCLEAGLWLLTGRFPCVFLTLGSFPCWQHHCSIQQPSVRWLILDPNMHRTHTEREKNGYQCLMFWYSIVFTFFSCFYKVLHSNSNAVIGEWSCEGLICDVQCQIYAKKDPCRLDRCFCGGLIGDVI